MTDFLFTIKCTECNNLQYNMGLCHIHYDITKGNTILNNLYTLQIEDINKLIDNIKKQKNKFAKNIKVLKKYDL